MFIRMRVLGIGLLLAISVLTLFTGASEATVDVGYIDVIGGAQIIDQDEIAEYDVSMDVEVTNGSADVSATISEATDGWTAWVDEGGNEITWTGVNESGYLNFTLYVQPPERAGSEALVLDIWANSTDGKDEATSLSTFVNGHSIEVTFPADSIKVSPEEGENIETVQFEVENTGDSPDDIKVTVDQDPGPNPGNLDWVDISYEELTGLGPDHTIQDMKTDVIELVHVEFDVGSVPIDAATGNYTYMITFDCVPGNPEDPGIIFTHYLTLVVDRVAGMYVELNETQAEIDVGAHITDDHALVDIMVQNSGNFNDTFKVQTFATSADVDISFDDRGDPAEFAMRSGLTRTIQMKITVDPRTRGGIEEFVIRISSAEGGFVNETDFNLTVLGPDIRFTKHDIQMVNPEPGTGEDKVFRVRVWNNGTSPATDLKISYYQGGILKGNYTIDFLRNGRYEDVIFDWDGKDRSRCRFQTEGAMPEELNIRFDFVRAPEEEIKRDQLGALLQIAAVGIIAGVVVMLYYHHYLSWRF